MKGNAVSYQAYLRPIRALPRLRILLHYDQFAHNVIITRWLASREPIPVARR